ncbi:uncharacterized protein PHACADRAFT_202099 [Phanerochaete carnosa HHB-10118-sp]|uniref:Uncharacterized protein n=1 Tax=Phanerochaete carnosa (strain HHB-10118-sp) TaxID=650164 RepID=K5WFR0_PHACS|nr:uncharacterized protein PHACADRAFT_202099 [Phanerochaete carnosa HHB-10118-sp]EKM49032.1 hypothetical protein PHACADRAFT_202099 [Phanerochaete carnosa HHB-10118-sp]
MSGQNLNQALTVYTLLKAPPPFALGESIFIHTCPPALVIYKFMITINDEISIIRKRPVTARPVSQFRTSSNQLGSTGVALQGRWSDEP